MGWLGYTQLIFAVVLPALILGWLCHVMERYRGVRRAASLAPKSVPPLPQSVRVFALSPTNQKMGYIGLFNFPLDEEGRAALFRRHGRGPYLFEVDREGSDGTVRTDARTVTIAGPGEIGADDTGAAEIRPVEARDHRVLEVLLSHWAERGRQGSNPAPCGSRSLAQRLTPEQKQILLMLLALHPHWTANELADALNHQNPTSPIADARRVAGFVAAVRLTCGRPLEAGASGHDEVKLTLAEFVERSRCERDARARAETKTDERPVVVPVDAKCPVCHALVLDGLPLVFCGTCKLPHHEDCWGGKCAAYACKGAGSTEATRRLWDSSDKVRAAFRAPAALLGLLEVYDDGDVLVETNEVDKAMIDLAVSTLLECRGGQKTGLAPGSPDFDEMMR